MIIKNGNLVLKDKILKCDILIEKNKILKIEKKLKIQNQKIIDAKNNYVTPGFIDIHTHGGYGSDFMDSDKTAFDNVLKYHIDNGTTSVVATTVTSPICDIVKFLKYYREYSNNSYSRLIGVHLEGPFLSLRNKGAQKQEYLLNPITDNYSFILDNSDIIKTVTISPELDINGNMTKELTQKGIIVCGGHDDGIYPDFMPSVHNGLKHLTHIYCAMSELRFVNGIRNIGLREYGLMDNNLTAEIIADNKHIPSLLAKFIIKNKGVDKVCVVSDSLRCAGMPVDGKLYRLGNQNDINAQLFKVSDGVAILSDNSKFAGSITPVLKMVKNLYESGVKLCDAVRMGTSNPANIIKRNDIGSIDVGKLADINILSSKLEILTTIINGIIYKNILGE